MFCFQCEQTGESLNESKELVRGCSTIGTCGKSAETARLQDLLVYCTQGISQYASRARRLGAADPEIDQFVLKSLFSTLTNVNFDEQRFVAYLQEAQQKLDAAKKLYTEAGGTEVLDGPAATTLAGADVETLVAQARAVADIPTRQQALGEDIVGLQELVMYGIKGTAAYAEHVEAMHGHKLGQVSADVYSEIHDAMAFLAERSDAAPGEILEQALKVGQTNLKVMGELNGAAMERYGVPEPTKVRTSEVAGKCILVSGHDLRDLEEILKATEGKGINVYTHGEMLPAHSYPGLKKYDHLVGNYGNAWQHQQLEFSLFPGPIVMTTNCIIEPRKNYKDRIFTRTVTGWPGVQHLGNEDNKFAFEPLIEKALECKGFTRDSAKQDDVLVGFGHNAILDVAPQVIEAVKGGDISHFFLIGGCDGAEGERSYFRDMALEAPKDSMILTLACGKYRFNKLPIKDETVAGLPRLLDMGQCNDTYSAVQVASALAGAFNTDVNGLPLTMVVSWFEQKAVAVLLSLLSLNIKGIYLGPKLPAFATPTMVGILQDTFDLKVIGDPKADMRAILNKD